MMKYRWNVKLPVFLNQRKFDQQSYLLRLRLSSCRAAEHILQQLVAGMICHKPCPPPRFMSNEPTISVRSY